MKKKLLILCLIGFLITGLPYVTSKINERALREKQEELAKKLGVKIEDYPLDFPVYYFYAVLNPGLKPGMTLDEVHNIVQGYERVFNCYGMEELYYYFGETENDAIRFSLGYDEQGRLYRMEVEDPNSPTLGLSEGCSEGVLVINKPSQ